MSLCLIFTTETRRHSEAVTLLKCAPDDAAPPLSFRSREIGFDAETCPNCGLLIDDGATRRFETRKIPGRSHDSIHNARFVPGTILNERYRIVGLLGKGGMGEVYRADDLKLGQPIAVDHYVGGFQIAVQHSHVVSGVETGANLPRELNGFIEAKTLGELMQTDPALRPSSALQRRGSLAAWRLNF